jgi:uncharacterized protein YjiS (DUF1127 family)
MARSLKVASRREETAGTGGWLVRLLNKIRRPHDRIDHLSDRMLRDIGLRERESPKLQQGVRRARP